MDLGGMAIEAALDRISRQDRSKLKGTEFDIVTRRLKRDGDMRYPLRSDERTGKDAAN